MKLIIDIPEEDYNFVKKQVADGITNPLKMRIANGIPLDKIRDEIEQKARPNELGGRGNGKSIRYGLCMALEIIYKYIKEISDADSN